MGVKSQSLWTQCKASWLCHYEKEVGISYLFTTKDGVALASLLHKFKRLWADKSEEEYFQCFVYLVQHLPNWYQQNAFSLPIINSKCNEIISAIKQQRSPKKGLSTEYLQQVLRDADA